MQILVQGRASNIDLADALVVVEEAGTQLVDRGGERPHLDGAELRWVGAAHSRTWEAVQNGTVEAVRIQAVIFRQE